MHVRWLTHSCYIFVTLLTATDRRRLNYVKFYRMRTSCIEEKEKWNDSYVAGGFAEYSFEEKDVFSCKLIIGLVLSLK